MRWIVQEPGSRNCGQIAVAVLAGVEVREVEEVVGHCRATKTKDLTAALRHFGITPLHYSSSARSRPEVGLAQVRSLNWRGFHWVAVDGERTWDGVYGNAFGDVLYPEGARETSWLPVSMPA